MRDLIVITDCDHGDTIPEEAVLHDAGYRVEVYQCRTPAEVLTAARSAVGLICQAAPITAEVLGGLPRLRVVGRYGVGLDNIDLGAATARGIRVVNVPDFCTDEVADHALALILTVLRRVVAADRALRADPAAFVADWPGRLRLVRGVRPARTLALGIVGCGRIGRAVARRAVGFGFRLLGFDPYVAEVSLRAAGIEPTPLADLLRGADIVTLHLPLTDETQGLIGAAELRLMKPSAYLINTARGGVVDEAALVRALEEGRIAGAAVDVAAVEPPGGEHPFLRLPGVIFTPHLAFYSDEAIQDVKTRVARYVVAALHDVGESALANPDVVRGNRDG